MDLKILFMMILFVVVTICLIFMIYNFFRKENQIKRTKYTYTIFYKSGKKVISSFSLTDIENKEFNDFLNKSPLVSSYNCREVE